MEAWAIALIIIGAVLFFLALIGTLIAVIAFASKKYSRDADPDEDESSDDDIDYFENYPFDETSDTEMTEMVQRPRIPHIKV